VCCGQINAEGRAFAGFALDFDFSPMRLDNHFALKHPDANTVPFSCLEWAK
jgi:hypothetical protein